MIVCKVEDGTLPPAAPKKSGANKGKRKPRSAHYSQVIDPIDLGESNSQKTLERMSLLVPVASSNSAGLSAESQLDQSLSLNEGMSRKDLMRKRWPFNPVIPSRPQTPSAPISRVVQEEKTVYQPTGDNAGFGSSYSQEMDVFVATQHDLSRLQRASSGIASVSSFPNPFYAEGCAGGDEFNDVQTGGFVTSTQQGFGDSMDLNMTQCEELDDMPGLLNDNAGEDAMNYSHFQFGEPIGTEMRADAAAFGDIGIDNELELQYSILASGGHVGSGLANDIPSQFEPYQENSEALDGGIIMDASAERFPGSAGVSHSLAYYRSFTEASLAGVFWGDSMEASMLEQERQNGTLAATQTRQTTKDSYAAFTL